MVGLYHPDSQAALLSSFIALWNPSLKIDTRMSKDDPSWLDRAIFPFTSRFVNVDGNRVHYIDEGTRPTLLLLHGSRTAQPG